MGNFRLAHCPERAIPGNTIYEMVNNDRIIGGIGTVDFSSEIAISLNFTAEHTESAEASEKTSNGWNRLKTLRTRRSPR